MATGLWRARALKAVLRQALKSSGMSAREVARRIDVSHTWVNDQLSPDKPAPSAVDVSKLLKALDIAEHEKNRIEAMAQSAGVDWLMGGTPGVNPQLAAALDCEQDAVRITECAPSAFPGLLQTRDYAHAIITRSRERLADYEVQTRVMLRIARAELLTRKREPVEFHAFVGMSAFTATLGGQQVMADQLEHVQEMTKRDNVTVQAIDMSGDWTDAHSGAWILYEFDDLPPAVYLEHLSSCAVLVEDADVEVYKATAEALRREAMSPEDTAGLIASVIPRLLGDTK